jgi:hypothetical protein
MRLSARAGALQTAARHGTWKIERMRCSIDMPAAHIPKYYHL